VRPSIIDNGGRPDGSKEPMKEIAMNPKMIAAAGAGILLLASTAAFAQLSDIDVKSAVEAKGYKNVRITHHDKDHVDVRATKDGKTVKLAVDPQTGAVKPDTDKDDDAPKGKR
jgi:hypothetical protein